MAYSVKRRIASRIVFVLAFVLYFALALAFLPGCELFERLGAPNFGCSLDPVTGEVTCHLEAHAHDADPVVP